MPYDDLLRLIVDPTRLRILAILAQGPLTVAEVQEVLDLAQSSASGHLAKLKAAGFIRDLAEGSARRYRLREDMEPDARRVWDCVRDLYHDDPRLRVDAEHLARLRLEAGTSWVDRVAGSLHRTYAPGRSWDSIAHALLPLVRLGVCADIGAGDGAMIEMLAPQATTLICVDPSEAMVSAGRQRIADLGLSHIRYLACAAEDLSLTEPCDTVLFLQSLQYIADPARALARAISALAPGGHLVILTLARHDHDDCRRYGHLHHGFSPEDLRSWMPGIQTPQIIPLLPETTGPRYQPLLAWGRKG